MISNKKMLKHLVSATSGEFLSLDELCRYDNPSCFCNRVGYAIESDNNIIYSPCSGTIIGISDKADLFNIYSDDGLIIQVHVGLHNYYTPKKIHSYVNLNDQVTRGQIIAIFEKEYILPSNIKMITPVYVKNHEKLDAFSITPKGRMEGGKSFLIDYKI